MITALFPSLVFHHQITDDEKAQLLEQCYKLKNQSPKSQQHSNMGGWHSPLIDVPQIILDHAPFEYTSHVAWYMVNNFGHGNSSHNHPQNDWSGVVYLKSPDPHAWIEFEHPQSFEQYRLLGSLDRETKDKYNAWQAFKFPPTENHMMFFPASLRHRVYANNTYEDRVSLAFNFKL